MQDPIERRGGGAAAAAQTIADGAADAINRRIFETSIDLILVVDRQGTFIRVSPSVAPILGYDPAEMVGRGAKEFLYPPDLDNTRGEMRHARRYRVTRNFECRYVHKGGRVVTLWWTGVWSDPEQQYFFIGRDVTRRRANERRIRESEARLALAVEIGEIGLATADAGATLTFVNTEFNDIYGLPRGNPTIRFGDWVRLIHPEDRDRVADEVRRAVRTGELYRGEFRISRPDTGDERWIRVAVRAHPDPAGGPVRVVAVNFDITDLKENARLLEAAMGVAQLGSWSSDIAVGENPDAHLQWSPETGRICGIDAAEFDNRIGTFWALIHPEDRDRVAEAWGKAVARGEPYDVELRIVRPDGATRWVHLCAGVIRDTGGAPTKMAGVIQDITELRSAQQQLRQAQKMEAIGNLTGGMAHDFNNLLGVIIGNLDLLSGSGSLDPVHRELLGEAIDAAARGADLTRRLLAFARRQPLQPRLIAVNAMVAGIVGMLTRTLGEQIPISLDLAEDVWPVRVDPAQLEASLVNLATNARDAMPGGGRLIIATANRQLDEDYAAAHVDLAPGDYAMIQVSDTGTGIPADVASRIFEPFFTTKEPGKGTGLGLSMVFGFVKQSGGHINVYSEPGVGTTFRLYLPRDRHGAEAGDPAVAAAAAATAVGGGETVLIVEDNVAMRRIVRRQLTELGYRVIEADGAEAALATLEREPVALLFSDIVMPGEMNGVALARAAIERWPALKVILTSGFPDARLGGNGDEITGIRLLSKPYRRAELAATLRAALDAGAPGA